MKLMSTSKRFFPVLTKTLSLMTNPARVMFFGFSLCLICAHLFAPLINIKYSFFVLFVGFFLIFSNLWTYISMLIVKARTYFWPYVSFKKKPIGIIGQTVIGFIITLLLTGLLDVSWKILKDIGAIATK